MSSELSRRGFLKLLGMLPLLGIEGSHPRKTSSLYQSQQAPNVLIFVLDALSARHVSLYGYTRETTPNLARFAQGATVYHAHYAGGNYTTPGVPSILTGTYPWSHRALNILGTIAEAYERKSLFGAFSEQGYNTVAYSHNPAVALVLNKLRQDLDLFKPMRELCLRDGHISDRLFPDDYNVAFNSEWLIRGELEQPTSHSFSTLDYLLRPIRRDRLEEEYGSLFPRGLPNLRSMFFILEHATDWLQMELSQTAQPFLIYLHLLPPHGPYCTRRDFVGLFDDGWTPIAKPPHFFSKGHSDERLNEKRQEYDEFIAYADAEFGRLYDFMIQTGVLDNSYIVFTSDHGEMFERGIDGHISETLYEPIIRVPLLISKPGQQRHEDVYTTTSAVDLLPTLLHATGQSIPDWCEGKVLPTFGEEARSERSVYVVEAKRNHKQAPLTVGTVALLKDRYKLVHYFGYDGYEDEYELYDLVEDPEEMEDLYPSGKLVAAELQAELNEKLREVNQPYLRS